MVSATHIQFANIDASFPHGDIFVIIISLSFPFILPFDAL